MPHQNTWWERNLKRKGELLLLNLSPQIVFQAVSLEMWDAAKVNNVQIKIEGNWQAGYKRMMHF